MNDIKKKSFDILLAKRVTLLLFLLFIPVAIVASLILDHFEVDNSYLWLILLLHGAMFIFIGVFSSFAKCPICEKPNNVRMFMSIPSPNCIHCGYNFKYPNTSNYKKTDSESN